MYDAIQAQPALVAEVLPANAAPLARAAELFAPQHDLYLCGIGTSFHATWIGAYLLRLLAGDHPLARAVHAFEFVHYPPRFRDGTAVLVVSHRGTKQYSLEALDRASRHGVPTVTITGHGAGEGIQHADTVLRTVEQELSAAHTKSYTTALALLAALAVRLGHGAGQEVGAADAQCARLPALMTQALQTEAQVKDLAYALVGKAGSIFIGGGPNAATAYEAALKMKETSYTLCEGVHVEQFLHGPIAGLSDEMVVWVIAPSGPSYARCLDVVKAAQAIGATTVALVQEGDQELSKIATHALHLPAVLEALSPLLYVLPLQWFSYYVALAKGTNPDIFHLDDPRHRQADTYYRL
jgi:glucosamine--fructose-6-phosphate aminotransferase (isomerizing)